MYGSLLLLVELTGVLMSIFVLCLQYKHLLMILLTKESLSLVLFMMVLTSCGCVFLDISCVLVVIIFGVCDASLSLAVMVFMINTHGSDYVKSFNMINC